MSTTLLQAAAISRQPADSWDAAALFRALDYFRQQTGWLDETLNYAKALDFFRGSDRHRSLKWGPKELEEGLKRIAGPHGGLLINDNLIILRPAKPPLSKDEPLGLDVVAAHKAAINICDTLLDTWDIVCRATRSHIGALCNGNDDEGSHESLFAYTSQFHDYLLRTNDAVWAENTPEVWAERLKMPYEQLWDRLSGVFPAMWLNERHIAGLPGDPPPVVHQKKVGDLTRIWLPIDRWEDPDALRELEDWLTPLLPVSW